MHAYTISSVQLSQTNINIELLVLISIMPIKKYAIATEIKVTFPSISRFIVKTWTLRTLV